MSEEPFKPSSATSNDRQHSLPPGIPLLSQQVELAASSAPGVEELGEQHVYGNNEDTDCEEMKCCRICLEDDCPEEMIAPCKCKGSSKWVHRECLDMWRVNEKDRAFSKCTECLFQYKLYTITFPDKEQQHRRMKYWFFVSRDVLFATLIFQLVIVFLAWVVWMVDKYDSIIDFIVESLGSECADDASIWVCHHTLSLYYLCGLFFLLVIMGCIGSVVLCYNKCSLQRSIENLDGGNDHQHVEGSYQQRGQQQHQHADVYRFGRSRRRHCCSEPCYCYSDPCFGCNPYFPYYHNYNRVNVTDSSGSNSGCCCCCGRGGWNRRHSENSDCCGSGASCGSFSSGGGGHNSGQSDGAHILINILLVAAVIMAMIGFLFGIIITVVACQRIMQRHLNMLNKMQLVEEYAVLDLASPSNVESLAREYDLNAGQTLAPPTSTMAMPLSLSDDDKCHLKKLGLME